MNLMDANIPEDIQEKLKIIEKEADFSLEMKSPKKKDLFSGVSCFTGVIAIFFTSDKNYILLAFLLVIVVMNIAGYFFYKKLYKMHSNARDIINYYRSREGKK